MTVHDQVESAFTIAGIRTYRSLFRVVGQCGLVFPRGFLNICEVLSGRGIFAIFPAMLHSAVVRHPEDAVPSSPAPVDAGELGALRDNLKRMLIANLKSWERGSA
jgi:hypothetical protein